MGELTTIAKSILNLTKLGNLQTPTTAPSASDDKVREYAVETLTLGLVWTSFHDAIKEGDGPRVMRYWKLLAILFHHSNRRNYAREAVRLQVQQHYRFSPRQKEQLIWSRFVNTVGLCGRNVSCDLHMEHLNRWVITQHAHGVVKISACIND